MTFDTFGDKTNPAVLLIHGMMCSSKDCMPFGKEMSDEFFVIMPTLDGHGHDGTDLLTVGKEAEKIIAYLKEEGINHLAMIQGSSMGAEVALEVKRQVDLNDITNTVCFFDGGPFFHFTPWFRAIMRMRFTKIVKILDTDNPEEAFEKLQNNEFLKFVIKDKIKQYSGLIKSMVEERRTFSKLTVRNLVNICYKCDLPKFDKVMQERLIFFFGTQEPARKSRKRLIKAYPNAEFKDMEGFSHCELQSSQPQKYAQMLKECIKSHK